jgi:hypothetical protein
MTDRISEQVAELKEYAGARHGEIARICWRAAETIEELNNRVQELERIMENDGK